MTNLRKVLAKLGNLHDCGITRLEWKNAESTVVLEIGDIYFNFERLPEYPGAKSGRIILQGVKRITMDFQDTRDLSRIYEFTIDEQSESGETANITFWPSGRMQVVFEKSIIPDLSLPDIS